MKFKLKSYKLLKNKKYLKTTKIFFLYNGNNLNTKNWMIIEQTLNKLNLKYYRVYNTLIIDNLYGSIYKNYIQLIHGNNIFISPKTKKNINLKNLTHINSILTLLCIILNDKLYSVTQIKNIEKLNYSFNIFILYKLLKKQLKIPYQMLKK